MSMTHDQRGRWARRVMGAEMPASQCMVLFALETFADWGGGGNAHPGEILLAETARVDVRTVRRALKAGVDCGLIEQTRPANPKAHKAAVYRLVVEPVLAVVDDGSTGHHSPVNNSTTGHQSPVETLTTGHHSPVNNFSTGQPSPFPPDTAVLPPKPLTNNQRVLRNWGTSPEHELASAHTIDPPSKFCASHPIGTPEKCPDCANARTHRKAWEAAQAEHDVALAAVEDIERRRRRKQIESCLLCDHYGLVDDIDEDGIEVRRRCAHEGSTVLVVADG